MMLPADLPSEMTRDELDLLQAVMRATDEGVTIFPAGRDAARMLAARGLVDYTGGIVTLPKLNVLKRHRQPSRPPTVREPCDPATCSLLLAAKEPCAR